MMKGLPVANFALFLVLLLSLTAIADDNKLEKNNNYPQQRGDQLQEYKNDIPQHGNYYKWDGKKWQRYEGNIPQVGCYLKRLSRLTIGMTQRQNEITYFNVNIFNK